MSSNSPPNYTEGVPIKISERYKPPPEIHLPTRVIQQFTKTNVPVAFDNDYDFNLERKIISKTSEWINIRLREKRERQERIHQRELARQRQIEEEQKLKLNQVSYPSADEISSCDEDDEVANGTVNPKINVVSSDKPFSPTNFNTILVPTQAQALPTSENTLGLKKSHRRYASNSSNKIDFSFFESDTSPFDNLEMKSMNEMEMLAEVLGSTTMSTTNQTTTENTFESDTVIDQKSNGNNNVVEHQTTTPQSIPQQTFINNYIPQNSASGYYTGSNYIGNYGMSQSPITAHHLSNNHFNYPQNNQQHQLQQQQHFTYPQNNAVNNQFSLSSFNSMMMMTNNNNNNNTIDTSGGKQHQQISDECKRSNIPSIIQELNDELNNSQRRRIRNHSQSAQKESRLPEGRLLLVFSFTFSPCSYNYISFTLEYCQLTLQKNMPGMKKTELFVTKETEKIFIFP